MFVEPLNPTVKMYKRKPTIYIGYDPKENLAFETLVQSLKDTSSSDLNIVKLDQMALRSAGLYRRSWRQDIGSHQRIDLVDNKPFSDTT